MHFRSALHRNIALIIRMDGKNSLKKRVKESLREFSQAHLSQAKYAQAAYYYNRIAAKLVEFRYKKPADSIVHCGVPLIYISQPARSGGTFLRNLFDGHRQCLVFPHELSWQKNGFQFDISLNDIHDARLIYKMLQDRWVYHAIVNGLDKRYPFCFNTRLQKKIFLSFSPEHQQNERYWLDVYLTSFFNAWIDYQNLYGPEKKYCVAFCPWNIDDENEVKNFFTYYPDGFRFQILRDPLNWWASVKYYRTNPDERYFDRYSSRWINAAKAGIQFTEKYPDRYFLLSFEELIQHPEPLLKTLCGKIGLPYDDIMRIPTINNIPRASNTSFGSGRYGIDSSVTDRSRRSLSEQESKDVRDQTESLYRQALEKCLS